jgi:hypothetical protein
MIESQQKKNKQSESKSSCFPSRSTQITLDSFYQLLRLISSERLQNYEVLSREVGV